jgi:hypothetical protein
MSRDVANHLRMLALEAMAVASEMSDPECRRTLEQIATAYEALADRLEAIEAPPPPAPKLNGAAHAIARTTCSR